MLIVGEKINGTIGTVKEEVKAHDEKFIIDLANSQLEKGCRLYLKAYRRGILG